MLAVIVVVLVLVGVAVGLVLARRGAAGVDRRVQATLSGLDVRRQEKVDLQRLASAGDAPAFGRGVLALTPEELVFVQFVPDRTIRVARPAITNVADDDGTLVVAWDDGDAADEAAWRVPDTAAWRAELGAH